MSPLLNRLTRKLHRWGAIIVLVPLALVIGTGLLLQVKKQVPWVQPASMRGLTTVPQLSWNEMLERARGVREAQIASWEDIERIDIQPQRGLAKITSSTRWELQFDIGDGSLLSSQYRRSDLIESLHDGSFFGDGIKLGVFLPCGILLLGLWLTGAYLWWMPIGVRLKKGRRLFRSRRNK